MLSHISGRDRMGFAKSEERCRARLQFKDCVLWNLSIVDTIGTQLAVLYREVSLIHR